MIETCQCKTTQNVGGNMVHVFAHPVKTYCKMLGVVGSNLTNFKLKPKIPKMLQQTGQTHTKCCAKQGCYMLH